MKTNEEYLDDYVAKVNKFARKGESWRLTITPTEFIEEIEKIRVRCIESRERGHLCESWIQNNAAGSVMLLLQGEITLEEMKAQSAWLHKEHKKRFAKDAPKIQEKLKTIQSPFDFADARHIYRWLCRQQITIEMLSEEVIQEFKETNLYQEFIKIRLVKCINKNEYETLYILDGIKI